MVDKILNVNSIIFISLQTWRQEKCTLNWDRLVQTDSVVTFIYFVNQILHLVWMEWGSTHQQLIAHNSNRPNINFVAVTLLLEQLWRAIKWCTTNAQLWIIAFVNNSTEPKVRNVSFKIATSQIEIYKELILFLFIHSVNFRIFWEVKQDICELNITMDNTKFPDVFASEYNLPKNLTDFELSYCLAQFEQYCEVKAVAIVLHHVDIRLRFYRVVQTHTILRLYHIVDLHFFLDCVQILLRDVCHFHYFASIRLRCF